MGVCGPIYQRIWGTLVPHVKDCIEESVAMRARAISIEKFLAPSGEATATKSDQIKFRVPGYLHDLIESAGKRNGWGASEEMRRRLEASFLEEAQAGDDVTYRLVRAIKTVAINVEPPFGKWHKNRFAFDTFRAGVLALIDLHRPAGTLARPSDDEIADMYLGEDGTPETAGRMIAGGAAVSAQIPLPGKPDRKKGR